MSKWILAAQLLPVDERVDMRGPHVNCTGHFNYTSKRWLVGDGHDLHAPIPTVTHWRGTAATRTIETQRILSTRTAQQLQLL